MRDQVYELVLIAKLEIARRDYLCGRIEADELRSIIEDVERKVEADRHARRHDGTRGSVAAWWASQPRQS